MGQMQPDPAAGRADSAVCAALLRTSVYWWGWMLLCGLVLGILLAASPGHWYWLVLAWPFWLTGTWLTMRLMLDATLFHTLAQAVGPDCELSALTMLDGALHRVLGVRHAPAANGQPRPMGSRVAGAMRLFRLLVALSLAHGLVLLAVVMLRLLND